MTLFIVITFIGCGLAAVCIYDLARANYHARRMDAFARAAFLVARDDRTGALKVLRDILDETELAEWEKKLT